MLAFGYKQTTAKVSENSLQAINMTPPVPAGRDLLIEIDAISVNPVDTKIRKTVNPDADSFKVLGWDAVGTVVDSGKDVSLFNKGDKVFYAGDVSRQGSNAELQLVDERIVGKAPTTLSSSEAAAMPLTSLTAYELLFDRLQVPQDDSGREQVLLVVGGAGGVGSTLIQLARKLTSLTIVATASRTQTKDWVKKMGAHHVVDHSQPLDDELKKLDIGPVQYVASLTHTDVHFKSVVNAMAAQGRFGLIDDPDSLDISLLKRKSISLHWEFMYTRPVFNTHDIQRQHNILNKISEMLDDGTLKSTMTNNLGEVNVQNLLKAHEIMESNRAIGKVVLTGFSKDRTPN